MRGRLGFRRRVRKREAEAGRTAVRASDYRGRAASVTAPVTNYITDLGLGLARWVRSEWEGPELR